MKKNLDLFNQQICTSCDNNQLGELKCKDCYDILCQKCFKAYSVLRLTCCYTNLSNILLLFMKERSFTIVKFVTKNLKKVLLLFLRYILEIDHIFGTHIKF